MRQATAALIIASRSSEYLAGTDQAHPLVAKAVDSLRLVKPLDFQPVAKSSIGFAVTLQPNLIQEAGQGWRHLASSGCD